MIVRDGPKRPRFPISLIHPLGPLFKYLPLSLRRHLLFLRAFETWGNFRTPKTFREKMQWRILNDQRQLLTLTCDKLATREYVRRTLTQHGLGGSALIPSTLWVGTGVDELRALSNNLPPRWVLKPNHSSGRVILIDSNVSPIPWDVLAEKSRRWLTVDEEVSAFGHFGYRDARKLIIAEERVGSGQGAPDDVRCVVFNGRVRFVTLSRAYGSPNHRVANYGPDLTTRVLGIGTNELPADEVTPVDQWSPQLKSRVVAVAEALGNICEHIRVDLYVESDEIWFSELTAYSTSGLAPISTRENLLIGGWWNLPDLNAPDPREDEWRALLEGVPKGTLQA